MYLLSISACGNIHHCKYYIPLWILSSNIMCVMQGEFLIKIFLLLLLSVLGTWPVLYVRNHFDSCLNEFNSWNIHLENLYNNFLFYKLTQT